MRRRVVVTGLGAITPVGNDVATTWRALQAGVSGASRITKFDRLHLSRSLRLRGEGLRSAEVDGAQGGQAGGSRTRSTRSPPRSRRWPTPGSPTARYDVDRTGVIVGSGIGGLKSFEEQHDVYRERGAEQDQPLLHPDVHRRHRGRRGLDALQRARAQLRHGLGVRHQRARDRRRVPHASSTATPTSSSPAAPRRRSRRWRSAASPT